MRAMYLVVGLLCLLTSITYAVYPYEEDEQIHGKVIFVTFPDDEDTVISRDFHETAWLGFKDYIEQHSNQKLVFSEDSGILLLPGDEFSDQTPVLETWHAELSASQYTNSASGDTVHCDLLLPEDYLDGIYGQLAPAWSSESEFASPLFAEILYKIARAYPGAANPFGDTSGGRGWELFFMFQVHGYRCDTPYVEGVGGRPSIYVNPGIFDTLIPEPGYFDNVRTTIESQGPVFAGIGQNFTTLPWVHPVPFLIEAASRVMAHEFGHSIGLGDGPPNLLDLAYSEKTYYYGSLNIMCQHYVPGRGIPPIGDPWLPMLPWNKGVLGNQTSSVRNVTGETLYGMKMYDVRAGGQLVGIDLGVYPDGTYSEERFLLAYHAGTGIDAQDTAGEPIVKSQGLAVWHCVANSMYDLESAVGLWDFYGAGQDTYVVPWENGVPEDVISGYDNYDLWRTVEYPEPGGEEDYRQNYGEYMGETYDFFRPEPEVPDPFYKNEFSFRTNPSTFGYSHDISTHEFLRRRPQDERNSIVVKVHEVGTDSIGDFILLDIMPAPTEAISFPVGGEVFAVGDTVDIAWESEFGEAITAVDISYSRSKGEAWTPLVFDLQPTPGDHTAPWFVTSDHTTGIDAEGLIKITYHNDLTEAFASRVMTVPFTVSGPPLQAEDIITPGAGDELYEGVATPLRWTSNMSGPWQFTLQWTHDGGDNFYSADTLLTWTRDPDTQQYLGTWTPGADHTGKSMQLRLKCYSHALLTTNFGSWTAPFTVYATGSGFHDITNVVLADTTQWYEGVPNSAIPVDIEADGDEDFLVVMSSNNESDAGVIVYRNVTELSGITFESVQDYDAFPSGITPTYGAAGITAGDMDLDGDRDLVVGMADGQSLRFYRNDRGGGFAEVTEAFADSSGLAACHQKAQATLFDANHDGYEDVLLASSYALPLGADRLLINAYDQDLGSPRFFAVDWATNGSTTMACTDMDLDGYWDLFSGDEGAHYLVQTNGDHRSFVDETDRIPAPLPGVVGACWLDANHENDLDLAVVTKFDGLRVFFGNRVGEDNDFDAAFFEWDYPAGWQPFGVSAVDYDLDGWVDLLVTGANEEARPVLLRNLGGDSGFDAAFIDVADAVGLAGSAAAAFGAAKADYDGDGDVDLMLARTTAQGRMYRNDMRSGGQTDPHWLAFDFSTCQRSALGSVIELTGVAGEYLGRAVLDGGRGVGGQDSGRVVLGLGDYSDMVRYRIMLPNATSIIDSTMTVDDVIAVSAPLSDLEILDCACVIEIEPGTGLLNWRFTWRTNEHTPLQNDVVHLSGGGCSFDSVDLDHATAGVEASVTYCFSVATGEAWYEHELVWQSQPCQVGCRYSYWIESDSPRDDQAKAETPAQTGRIKICPQSL